MLIAFIIGMSVGACLGIGLLCVFQRGAASESAEACPYCGTGTRNMPEHLRKAHGGGVSGWQKT